MSIDFYISFYGVNIQNYFVYFIIPNVKFR